MEIEKILIAEKPKVAERGFWEATFSLTCKAENAPP